jgi:enoyl-CoA hydratase
VDLEAVDGDELVAPGHVGLSTSLHKKRYVAWRARRLGFYGAGWLTGALARTERDSGADGIRYEIDGDTASVTFDRPEALNAFTPAMMRAGARAIHDADGRDEIRAIVVTGAGDAFCAGADLAETIPRWTEDPTHVEPDEADLHLRRDVVTTPIVAAVNGDCLAGGMEFLQATDVRIAAESARFGLPEPRWGVSPVSGSHVRLPRQLPYARAMEYLLTGGIFPAEHALEAGLVNDVVPDGESLARAEAVVDEIAQNSPHAIGKIKETVLRCDDKPLDDAFRLESEIGRAVFAHQDAVEGPRAFVEGTEPSFRPD